MTLFNHHRGGNVENGNTYLTSNRDDLIQTVGLVTDSCGGGGAFAAYYLRFCIANELL